MFEEILLKAEHIIASRTEYGGYQQFDITYKKLQTAVGLYNFY